MAAARNVRHSGVVLGLTVTEALVGIIGLHEFGEEVWIDRDVLPATLHKMEAGFDVWLRVGDPPEKGAYRPVAVDKPAEA